MHFYETPEGRVGLSDIPAVLADLLRQVPHCGDRENEAVESRLFPSPSIEPEEEDLRQDWKAHVEPELHELFQSSRQVVEADLRGMKEEEEMCSIEFPSKHIDAWLNALNQARLALAEQHGFRERELSQGPPTQVLNERDLALLQIDLYGMFQMWLVEALEA